MGKVHAVISLPAASFLALRAGKRYLEMILMGIRGPKALGGSDGTGPDPCVPRISAEISCPDRPPYSSVGNEALLNDSFRVSDPPGTTPSLDPGAFVGTDPARPRGFFLPFEAGGLPGSQVQGAPSSWSGTGTGTGATRQGRSLRPRRRPGRPRQSQPQLAGDSHRHKA